MAHGRRLCVRCSFVRSRKNVYVLRSKNWISLWGKMTSASSAICDRHGSSSNGFIASKSTIFFLHLANKTLMNSHFFFHSNLELNFIIMFPHAVRWANAVPSYSLHFPRPHCSCTALNRKQLAECSCSLKFRNLIPDDPVFYYDSKIEFEPKSVGGKRDE